MRVSNLLTDFKVDSDESASSAALVTENFCSRQNEYNNANQSVLCTRARKKKRYFIF